MQQGPLSSSILPLFKHAIYYEWKLLHSHQWWIHGPCGSPTFFWMWVNTNMLSGYKYYSWWQASLMVVSHASCLLPKWSLGRTLINPSSWGPLAKLSPNKLSKMPQRKFVPFTKPLSMLLHDPYICGIVWNDHLPTSLLHSVWICQ